MPPLLSCFMEWPSRFRWRTHVIEFKETLVTQLSSCRLLRKSQSVLQPFRITAIHLFLKSPLLGWHPYSTNSCNWTNSQKRNPILYLTNDSAVVVQQSEFCEPFSNILHMEVYEPTNVQAYVQYQSFYFARNSYYHFADGKAQTDFCY